MRSHLPSVTALALAALTFMPASSFAADPTGIWLDDRGRGAIEIKPCGDQLCGHVVWVKSASDKRGCGKQIIGDVTKVTSRRWDKGWIYSPDRNKKYSVELKLLDKDHLQVTGYAGIKYFSETMIWTRAPSDLERCEEVAKLAPDGKDASAPRTNDSNTNNKNEQPAAKGSGDSAPATVEPQSSKAAPKVEKPKLAVNVPSTETKPQQDPAAETKKTAKASQPKADDVPLEAVPDLSKLPIKKYFEKTADGRCKLNLPWVNLDFSCSRTE